MGCDQSKTTQVEQKNKVSGSANQEARTCFSDLHMDVIRSTWPLISSDMLGNGTRVFMEIFNTEPRIKKMFPFRNVDSRRLHQDQLFRLHMLKFMETIGSVCDNLDRLTPDDPVGRQLMVLGAQHATIRGFDLYYFSVFVKCLHVTWELLLGEEYTDDVRQAWTHVFDYIVGCIRDGHRLYHEDVGHREAPPAVDKVTTQRSPGGVPHQSATSSLGGATSTVLEARVQCEKAPDEKNTPNNGAKTLIQVKVTENTPVKTNGSTHARLTPSENGQVLL